VSAANGGTVKMPLEVGPIASQANRDLHETSVTVGRRTQHRYYTWIVLSCHRRVWSGSFAGKRYWGLAGARPRNCAQVCIL